MVLSGSRGHSKHPLLSHTTEAKDPTKQGWKEHVQLELPRADSQKVPPGKDSPSWFSVFG